jgi:hypothetical protein
MNYGGKRYVSYIGVIIERNEGTAKRESTDTSFIESKEEEEMEEEENHDHHETRKERQENMKNMLADAT